MILFIVLLLWSIWTTWEGRPDCVARVRRFLRRSPTSNQRQHPLSQPGSTQSEHNDGQETTPFQSIHVDPSPGPTGVTQVY